MYASLIIGGFGRGSGVVRGNWGGEMGCEVRSRRIENISLVCMWVWVVRCFPLSGNVYA